MRQCVVEVSEADLCIEDSMEQRTIAQIVGKPTTRGKLLASKYRTGAITKTRDATVFSVLVKVGKSVNSVQCNES
jgi:hypothetical protein